MLTTRGSIIDVHSHIGVGASPELSGAEDSNSVKGPTQPWLRSLDGLNTHDASYELAIAGGLTTSLILPGSADAMGEHLLGETWGIGIADHHKYRWTGFCNQNAPNI